jgi:pimeloyl-ACP methyl ester carboxylesterase
MQKLEVRSDLHVTPMAFEARSSLERLTRAVLDVRPLVNALESPVRVVPMNEDGDAVAQSAGQSIFELEQLLTTVATRAGAPRLRLHTAAADLTVIEQVVSKQLRLEDYREVSARVSELCPASINEIVDHVLDDTFERRYRCSRVAAFDGAPLRAYTSGEAGSKVVIIVLPCGMPAQLCPRWLDFLGKDYFTITWETRGLFAEPENFDALSCEVAAQAEDLFAVMDHFAVQSAHVMGLCGGAAIALKAAAAQPARVCSLSLWHGDFNLGVNSPQTTHQRHLRALMTIGSGSRSQAVSLHKLFQQSMMINVRADLAHLVLYPYATPEVLFRYAKLNGSIMHTDISEWLGSVTQRTLVVTSEADSTTHPESSIRVAKALANATLHVEPVGDHLSLFDAEPHITTLATQFIAGETSFEKERSDF